MYVCQIVGLRHLSLAPVSDASLNFLMALNYDDKRWNFPDWATNTIHHYKNTFDLNERISLDFFNLGRYWAENGIRWDNCSAINGMLLRWQTTAKSAIECLCSSSRSWKNPTLTSVSSNLTSNDLTDGFRHEHSESLVVISVSVIVISASAVVINASVVVISASVVTRTLAEVDRTAVAW